MLPEDEIEQDDLDNEDVEDSGTSGESDIFQTEWKKPPTVAELKKDYTDAQATHDAHVAKVTVWLDNLNITGKAKRPKKKGRSSLTPKVIRKQAEWRYAALSEPFLSTDDIFNTAPETAEDKKAAVQNGLILNNQFNTKIDKVGFIDEFIRTVVDEGTVVVRVGWQFEEEKFEVELPAYEYHISADPNAGQMLQQAEQNPSLASEEMIQALALSQQHGKPILPVQVGTKVGTDTKTISNHPTIEVCDYRNVIIDPMAKGEVEKANFIIYQFETSLAELSKDPRYKNLDKINKETNSILNESDSDVESGSFNYTDNARKKFIAYEYWGNIAVDGEDETTLTPIVATWVGDVMIRLEQNPFPDQQHPFVSVQYLPVRKSNYGEPDGELILENQQIIGATTRGIIDTMGRSANAQQGIRKDALDVTNRRLFDKGMDYEYNGQSDPRLLFHTHQYPEIPQSAQWMIATQNADAESLTGVKAFSGGSGISGTALGDSVGGIKSALDATAKRELGILRRISAGMKKIARKFISMNSEFLSDIEVIRVTNELFVEVRKDDLAGKMDIKLTISTPEADNAKAEELAFLLQTTGQTMGPDFTRIILADIARLRKMPDMAQRIEDFVPQPDPLEVKKQQLEVALLEAQIRTEQSKAVENQANAILDQAKAADLGSTKDLKDLQFVETESGVTQERELEKGLVQAKGNIALERVKQQSQKNNPSTTK